MELIKLGYEKSKPVKKYREIETEAWALKKFIIEADKKRQCYAIHHAQVHTHPYNFFVVHPRYCLGDERFFNDMVIINPKIIENVPYTRPPFDAKLLKLPDTPEQREIYERMPAQFVSQWQLEGCMSFPHRKPKKVERFVAVKVSYQNEKFELITTVLEGPAGHIFQHETDHGQGKNIYFDK